MPLITIGGTTIGNWWDPNPNPELRIFATDSFIASDGTIILPAPGEHVAVALSLSGVNLSIPQFTLYSTTDGYPNPYVKYRGQIFASGQQSAPPVQDFNFGGLTEFFLPHDPTTTSWPAIASINKTPSTFRYDLSALVRSTFETIDASQIFPANVPIPSVTSYRNFITANTQSTNYTNFIGPYNGKTISILINDTFTSILGIGPFSPGDIVDVRYDLGVWAIKSINFARP